MSNVILRGFAGVARFRGRDTRSQFWPYCAAVFGLYLVVGWALLIPVMWPVFTSPQVSSTDMDSILGPFLLVSLLMAGVLVALLAGAVARRLHDSSRSAIWGALPLPFAVYGAIMFFKMFGEFDADGAFDMPLFLSVFVSDGLYFAALAALIVLLARPSTPSANRYG